MPLAEHDDAERKDSGMTFVSIHVPLAEHDDSRALISVRRSSFNSRAPRGARRNVVKEFGEVNLVSIHVPLAEHDIKDDSGHIRV